MKTQKSYDGKNCLYLIASPIGNLSDITLRALEILKKVDYLYCEDTRVTNKLLMHFAIKAELRSFHEHNKNSQKDEIVELLKQGYNIGLISDAGTPCISDPGYEVVEKAIEEGQNVVSIPGASALISALITSGIICSRFVFLGFLDSRKSQQVKTLNEYKDYKDTLVIYEAPHRIKETLTTLYEVLGNRKTSISREITKIHEEIIRGNLVDLIDYDGYKGEMVIVISGNEEEKQLIDIEPNELVEMYLEKGDSLKEATKKAAKDLGVSSREIYNDYVFNKKN